MHLAKNRVLTSSSPIESMTKVGAALVLCLGMVACGAPLPGGDEDPPGDDRLRLDAGETQSVQDVDGLRLEAETKWGAATPRR